METATQDPFAEIEADGPPGSEEERLGGYNPSDDEDPGETLAGENEAEVATDVPASELELEDGALQGDTAEPVAEEPAPETPEEEPQPIVPADDLPAEATDEDYERKAAEEAVAEAEAEESLIEDLAEPPIAPPPEPEPEPTTAAKSKARRYLVFEETKDGTWNEVLTADEDRDERGVEARNGENALRKAYRLLAAERDENPETTLVVVAERMWRPTPIKARAPRTAMAIEIG